MPNPSLIIAEAEINHNGDVALAKKLVTAAAEAGADVVKFQCFVPEGFIAPGSSYLPTFEGVALSLDEFREIRDHAAETGIGMLSTAGDIDGLRMIVDLGLDAVKVGSTNINHLGLLNAIAETGKKTYLSTGASTLGEIETALEILSRGVAEISLFHCTVQYPAEAGNLNLNALSTLVAAFPGIDIGYSDHTVGNTAAIAARALGAVMFEKHFTLDHNLEGPDHNFSADPAQLRAYIEAIRETESMLGSGRKIPADCEHAARLAGRRYMTAMTDIPENTVIEAPMIRPRRVEIRDPQTGRKLLGPEFEQRILGSRSRRAIAAGESLYLDLFDL